MYKMKTMPKVKVFIWRMAKRCIPTKERLRDKGVHIEDGCYLCEGGDESL